MRGVPKKTSRDREQHELHSGSAIDQDIRTREHRGIVGDYEQHRLSDVLWGDQAAERSGGDGALIVLRVVEAGARVVRAVRGVGADKWRIHVAGRDQYASDVIGGV